LLPPGFGVGERAIGERPTPVAAQITALWLLPVLALGAVLRFYQLGERNRCG
jgi:hypothetical protein